MVVVSALVLGALMIAAGVLLLRFARHQPTDAEVAQPEGMSSLPGLMYGGRADNPRARLVVMSWVITLSGAFWLGVGLLS